VLTSLHLFAPSRLICKLLISSCVIQISKNWSYNDYCLRNRVSFYCAIHEFFPINSSRKNKIRANKDDRKLLVHLTFRLHYDSLPHTETIIEITKWKSPQIIVYRSHFLHYFSYTFLFTVFLISLFSRVYKSFSFPFYRTKEISKWSL